MLKAKELVEACSNTAEISFDYDRELYDELTKDEALGLIREFEERDGYTVHAIGVHGYGNAVSFTAC